MAASTRSTLSRTSRRVARGMLAALALSWCAIATAGPQWNLLGPEGGSIQSVAAGTGGSGKVYALVTLDETRIFASDDNGLHWIEQAALANCASGGTKLQVRGDSEVFLHCGTKIMRSRDGARSWAPYTPTNVDGPLALDPFYPYRAIVGPAVSGYTTDDGHYWTLPYPQMTGSPRLTTFDPLRANRIIGVGTDNGSGAQLPTRYYESRDFGVTWQVLGDVVPSGTTNCFERNFAVDQAGRLFAVLDCGLFRSVNGGATWTRMSAFPGNSFTMLIVDPANGGRLIAGPSPALSGADALYESRDAGASWKALPALPAQAIDAAVSGAGALWVATTSGVYLHDPATYTWISRNVGLDVHSIGQVEAGMGTGLVLTALGSYPPRGGNVQSLDGGRTWAPLLVDGKLVARISRNVIDPGSLFAWTYSNELYASSDGGVTWGVVTTYAALGNQLVGGFVAAGPQPGIVYGLYHKCVIGFDICFWVPQGVAKSVDGGKTWSDANAGIPDPVSSVVVSAADVNVAFAANSTALYVTRDGGLHWQPGAPTVGTRVVADPADPARWYALGNARELATTADYGAHWSMVADAGIASTSFDLLIEPHDPRMLYAVGRAGDVSVSIDRGARWQRIVEPSATLLLVSQSARLAPNLSTTIFAATDQGVLRLNVANYQGLWWNAPANSESGWGINLAHQDDTIFATWFTYDATGKAWWLAMTADKTSDGRYSGTLYETHGPAFNATPFDPALVTKTPVGSGTLTFDDADNGAFDYALGAITQSKRITREVFGTVPTCIHGVQPDLTQSANYQDLWWKSPAGSESGWGLNLTHQGDTMFATWFTYDLDTTPLWLVATAQKTGPATYAGTLYRTSGPRFDAFDPAKVVNTPVGTATVTFANGNAGTFAYSVNVGAGPVSGSKPITREIFRAPGTVCQ